MAAAPTTPPSAVAAPSVATPSVFSMPANSHAARRNLSFQRMPYHSALPPTAEDAVLPSCVPVSAAGPVDEVPVGRSSYPSTIASQLVGFKAGAPTPAMTSASNSVAQASHARAGDGASTGQHSDQELDTLDSPLALPVPRSPQAQLSLIAQRLQGRTRSSSMCELNPQVLASKLRSLSLTNWDKRAQFSVSAEGLGDHTWRQITYAHATRSPEGCRLQPPQKSMPLC